jgi:transglutaminase-like putative cysteine protease
MRLDIRYVTRFDYGSSVVESQNELRACPANDAHQQVVHYRVTTTPASRVSSYVDYWGTRVDTFGIGRRTSCWRWSRRRPSRPCPRPAPDGHDVPLAAWRMPAGGTRTSSTCSAHRTSLGRAGREHARGRSRGADDVRGLVEAVERRSARLEYRRGRTVVGVHVEEVLAAGAGVCQDFAHLTIAMLRVLGVPARYVSGYFFTVDDRTGMRERRRGRGRDARLGRGASPGSAGGRRSDQPAAVGERHVTIGRGRDYDDVAPLRGVFNGAPEHELEVNVSMRRLALEPIGTPGAPGLFPAVDAVSGSRPDRRSARGPPDSSASRWRTPAVPGREPDGANVPHPGSEPAGWRFAAPRG